MGSSVLLFPLSLSNSYAVHVLVSVPCVGRPYSLHPFVSE